MDPEARIGAEGFAATKPLVDLFTAVSSFFEVTAAEAVVVAIGLGAVAAAAAAAAASFLPFTASRSSCILFSIRTRSSSNSFKRFSSASARRFSLNSDKTRIFSFCSSALFLLISRNCALCAFAAAMRSSRSFSRSFAFSLASSALTSCTFFTLSNSAKYSLFSTALRVSKSLLYSSLSRLLRRFSAATYNAPSASITSAISSSLLKSLFSKDSKYNARNIAAAFASFCANDVANADLRVFSLRLVLASFDFISSNFCTSAKWSRSHFTLRSSSFFRWLLSDFVNSTRLASSSVRICTSSFFAIIDTASHSLDNVASKFSRLDCTS
mmetsp:Transcript_9138/g.29478  ORF Transcript_9138/g.29478 Transcript_9138/m.29478 type:complete len:326 (+) Transcript_9138:95-1072(+)